MTRPHRDTGLQTPRVTRINFGGRSTLAWLAWAVLFVAALFLDRSVADAVHDNGIAAALRRHALWLTVWKVPGEYWFTAAVVGLGWFVKWLNGREACFVLLAGAFSSLNVLVKWVVGRTRPFKLGVGPVAHPFELHPFRGGGYGFFHQQNLSFPSGHECTASALALAILWLRPGAAAPFVLFATAVGVERVMENAHYCSDVLGAFPVAVAGVALAWRVTCPRRVRFGTRPAESAQTM